MSESLRFDEDAALRKILHGTATESGEDFFAALVRNLAEVLHTHGGWITEYDEPARSLKALSFWIGGNYIPQFEYPIAGTPCEAVVRGSSFIHIPDRIIELYPNDSDLIKFEAVSYMGIPLKDLDGVTLGHLAVLDNRPMPENSQAKTIFHIFASRAAAELRQVKAQSLLRQREEKLSRLVDGAMDAIVEFDEDCAITLMNHAAEKFFNTSTEKLAGKSFLQLLSEKSSAKLQYFIRELESRTEGERYLWVPGSLEISLPEGTNFQAEATLSQSNAGKRKFHTLILRNVNDRIQAERKIYALTEESQYLREEIRSGFDEMIGESDAILQTLQDVRQVAETDTTVLIYGETGTGKELVARAIHELSKRQNKPLIKVNCAALPSTLIESELFGHEQGAFTGASKKRIGRFALADQGTLFLDEIGEVPLDLQAKLLRVLQEGEFEPVGSSRTEKVNVRLIAATNRNLTDSVKKGLFREDLYYRLNVFFVEVPPLRKRGNDILLLAKDFAAKSAHRIGRRLDELSEESIRLLLSYDWPGNVRELQNVIERAVITSQDGRLNLNRALPQVAGQKGQPSNSSSGSNDQEIFTVMEMENLERLNLVKALEATGWKVAGDSGAARLLGMNPSTFSSRMKALGIKRPQK